MIELICPGCRESVQVDANSAEASVRCSRCQALVYVATDAEGTLTLNRSPIKPHDSAVVPGYEVLEILGRGGMGVVYKARQQRLKRVVALKMILSGSHADETDRARFAIEAEAIARLQHPNIVQIHEIGEHEGRPCFSLEYVDGGSLAQQLGGTPLAPDRAAGLLLSLAQAMQYAHERGIVHRDLKPANVLLTAGQSPKITDFGLAKQLGEDSGQTHTGQVMGTPSYMSPEQAAGDTEALGPPTDIYALGAILYECLTGRPPFKGATLLDTLEQVRTQEPVPPSRLQPKIPRDLETVCIKSLHKTSRKRYLSAGELASDLGRFLAGEPVRARPVGRGEQVWRWCRRNPYRAAAGALVILLLCGATVFALVFARQQGELAKRQTRLAEEQAESARKLELEQRETKLALEEANRQRSLLTLERAVQMCEPDETSRESGDVYTGMLWLARALELAPPDDAALQHAIRSNLAAWHMRTCSLTRQYETRGARELAISPNGRLMVAAFGWPKPDGGEEFAGLQVVDLETGKTVSRFHRLERTPLSIAYHPLAPGVAAGLTNGKVHQLEIPSLKSTGPTLEHSAAVHCVAYSPNGARLLTACGDAKARLWDAITGELKFTWPLPEKSVVSGVFNPDGKVVTIVGQGPNISTIRTFNADTGALIFKTDTEGGSSLSLSPDGTQLLVGEWNGATLYDVEKRRRITGLSLKQERNVRSVAIGAGGRRYVTKSGSGKADVWQGAAPHLRHLYVQHSKNILLAAFHPDGSLFTGSEEGGKGLIRRWRLPADNLPPLAIPPDAAEPPKHVFMSTNSGGLECLAVSPDGQTLVAGDWNRAARLWNLATGKLREEKLEHEQTVLTATFSKDGRTIITGSADGTARLWHSASGQPTGPVLRHKHPVLIAALHPKQAVAYTGLAFEEGQMPTFEAGYLSDLTSAMPTPSLVPNSKRSWAAKWAFDGEFLLKASWQGSYLYETSTWKPVGDVRVGCAHWLHSLAVSPNSEQYATGGVDGEARLWETRSGAPVGSPMSHRGPIRGVEFSPDGQSIATASEDGTVRLWSTALQMPIGPKLEHHSPVHAVVYSRDGRQLYSRSREPGVQQWSVPAPVEGDVARLVLWVQVLTGMEMLSSGGTCSLEYDEWLARQKRLQAIGGNPTGHE